MSVIDVFPRRPLQLTPYYERPTKWWIILSCIGICGVSYWVYLSTLSLVDDFRLRVSGTVALQSAMENGVCHLWLVNECEFDARYMTQDGHSHTRHVELLTVFQEPDQESRFIVRYDAASPEHISTTWGVPLLFNRTISTFLGLAFVVLAITYAISLVVNPRRARRKLSAIGAQPTPVEVTFVKANALPNSQSMIISYSSIDASGRVLTGKSQFRGVREPFWLDGAKTKMLALAGPGGETQLLDAGLAWVSLTKQERTRVIEARDRALGSKTASAPGLRTGA
jgi:hypothetical protein